MFSLFLHALNILFTSIVVAFTFIVIAFSAGLIGIIIKTAVNELRSKEQEDD